MNFQQASLRKISVHFIGHPSMDEPLIVSKEQFQPEMELSIRLKDYFLKHFKADAELYRFYHPSSLQYNEIYNFVGEALTGHSDFHQVSVNIARHLHSHSDHPKIKSGELYVCHFEEIFWNNVAVSAFGIFKTEQKNGFFEIDRKDQEFELKYKEGIDLNKIDKACLVLDTNFEDGFEVLVIDAVNKGGEEARYWMEDFLRVEPIQNEFHQTKSFLELTKSFVTQQLSQDVAVERADQIDLLNRSVQYFKAHDTFDRNEFETEVFQENEVIESFRNYGNKQQEIQAITYPDQFKISETAVKKQAKVFKSVLKLDKNFHIYIHGDRDLIERGTDEMGRKFYKIYFDQES